MQELALRYDNTQCQLLQRARQVEQKAHAEVDARVQIQKRFTQTQEVKPTKLAKKFYEQIVEERRKLEELDIKVNALKSTFSSSGSNGIALDPQVSGVGELPNGTRSATKSRRASVSVRSMLDSASLSSNSSSPASKRIFEVIPDQRITGMSSIKNDEAKQNMFQKGEFDKMRLIMENKKLRDSINCVSVDDPESRTIVSELKAWEQERDMLESQIQQQEDYIDSLRSRIINFKSGNV